MKKSENTRQGICISLARRALGAATLLACVPTLAQTDPWQSQTRVLLEYAIPFGLSSHAAQERPYLGLTMTHAVGTQALRYMARESNRLTMVDIRLDPQSGSFSKLGVGGVEFANRPRVYATESVGGSNNNEWTPAAVLAGIAVTGGVLALLLHEAASVQPPGCNIANVIVCK
ncbi:MAG: hypothetical protein WCK94_07590 [Comamonadaceae bacterium]|jgi:hypothetical protein